MSFFGMIGSAIGSKSTVDAAKKLNATIKGETPVATDHKHSSEPEEKNGLNSFEPIGGDGIMDAEERADNFMGRNKSISDINFNDVDRSGKVVENSPVQTAGTFPPLSTPDFTPREEFDQYGKQFIS